MKFFHSKNLPATRRVVVVKPFQLHDFVSHKNRACYLCCFLFTCNQLFLVYTVYYTIKIAFMHIHKYYNKFHLHYWIYKITFKDLNA